MSAPSPEEGWIYADDSTPEIPNPYWFGKLSAVVEVTDGVRVGRACFREADSILADEGEELWHMSGFVSEDYEELDWCPTHWRPLKEER